MEYGIRNYGNHPERQIDYFSLQSADSKAVMQRERHGTLLVDNERKLDLYLRGLWEHQEYLVPYSLGFDELRKPVPYYDKLGIRLPDVYDDFNGIAGIDRYRATLAHVMAATSAGPRRFLPTISAPSSAWPSSSSKTPVSNTWPFRNIPACAACSWHCTPSRWKTPAIRKPPPACAIAWPCCRTPCSTRNMAIRMPHLNDFVARFHEIMAKGESSTEEIADLAISYVARTRRQSDQLAKVHFDDTEIDYRDDNRHMWRFHEQSDDEEMFDDHRKVEWEEEPRACRRAITRNGTTSARPSARTG